MSQPVSTQSVNSTVQSAVMMRAPLAVISPLSSSGYIPGKTLANLDSLQSAHHVHAQQNSSKQGNTKQANTHEVMVHASTAHQTPARFRSTDPQVTTQRINMYVTIDTKWVTALRYLVVNTFSDIVLSIRIQPVDHAKKMKVCLCFSGRLERGNSLEQGNILEQGNRTNPDASRHQSIEERLMTAIMRTLPSAEFGRISCA